MAGRLNKVKRELSFRNLRRRIQNGRSNSDSMTMIDGENDEDHLLENVEPPDTNVTNDEAFEKESSRPSDKDKYQIPSSIIVLNDEDKKRLEYVLLQIGLREVGLG